jgi:hypothetical protein
VIVSKGLAKRRAARRRSGFYNLGDVTLAGSRRLFSAFDVIGSRRVGVLLSLGLAARRSRYFVARSILFSAMLAPVSEGARCTLSRCVVFWSCSLVMFRFLQVL